MGSEMIHIQNRGSKSNRTSYTDAQTEPVFSYIIYFARYSPGVQEVYFLNTLEK